MLSFRLKSFSARIFSMEEKRRWMVEKIRVDYGFDASLVLEILQKVPRLKFLQKKYWKNAYDDAPVSIGFGQTMSQPYTVAFMTYLISRKSHVGKASRGKVLEIGTGSGYQAVVLSYFFDEVYTVEIIPELAEKAKNTLKKLNYENVFVRTGSGEWGWKDKGPFDAIMITAGIEKVPGELFNQLKVGGVLVAPVGEGEKVMTRFTKLKKLGKKEIKVEEFGKFNFVPFVKHD